MQQALDLMGKFDQDGGIRDIEATIKAIRDEHGADTKVGVVGYCLGGRLAFMTAARTDVDASVGYYGVGIDGLLGEKQAIAKPVLLHIPEEDHFVDKDAQKRMHEGLDDHPKSRCMIMRAKITASRPSSVSAVPKSRPSWRTNAPWRSLRKPPLI